MTAGGTPGFRNSRDGYSTFLKLWRAPVYQNPLLLESVEPPNLVSSATCPLGTLVALLSCEQSHSKAGKRLAACPLLRSHRAAPPRNLGGCFGSKKTSAPMRKISYREGLRTKPGTKKAAKSSPRKASTKKATPANPALKPAAKKTANPATPRKAHAKTPNRQKAPK